MANAIDRRTSGARRVLDEFAAVTGLHRKHAMRLLRAKCPAKSEGVRRGRRVYSEAVRIALVLLWEAADRLCGKRLRPLIPILLEAMERHGHLDVASEVKTNLTRMSAATIDRALREVKVGGHSPEATGRRWDRAQAQRAGEDVLRLGRTRGSIRCGCCAISGPRRSGWSRSPTRRFPPGSARTPLPNSTRSLSGLRIAWKIGEVRPTDTDKAKAPRGRRRPDPLIDVTAQLKRWFEEEPWRTGRELLEKLQTEQPGDYPESLLRTVQRRLKIWRSEQALALVFSGSSGSCAVTTAAAEPAMVQG